jgi:hypothetical protein
VDDELAGFIQRHERFANVEILDAGHMVRRQSVPDRFSGCPAGLRCRRSRSAFRVRMQSMLAPSALSVLQ